MFAQKGRSIISTKETEEITSTTPKFSETAMVLVWTLMPVFRANRTVVSSLLLQRCQSIPIDAAKFTAYHDLCVSSTENAQQTEDSWVNFALEWLPRCGASFESPGIVFIDGHSSHVTREFIYLAARYGLYVVVEPSHTSILLQVADVGINPFYQNAIRTRIYCEHVCSRSNT